MRSSSETGLNGGPLHGENMQRRELLLLGGLTLAGVAAPEAGLTQIQPSKAWTSFLHVWADESGVSHAENVPLIAEVKPIPVAQLSIRPAPDFLDWHHPTSPQFVVTIFGQLEVEVSDGTRMRLPESRLSYLEDMTGKGHIARGKIVTNLYLQTPPGFDVRRWASGQA
jgi:hypothetical protein